jgi:hypothetical protein
MRTGGNLRIQDFGENAMGVRLTGNPKSPEPIYFVVKFPGGDVSVVRTADGDNWVHVRVDRPGGNEWVPGEMVEGRILDARLDLLDKHASETDPGDFKSPSLYHAAVRVTTKVAP